MNAEGRCRSGGGYYVNANKILDGVLAQGEALPPRYGNLRIPDHDRCPACIAKGVRCFHDYPWETGDPEIEEL